MKRVKGKGPGMTGAKWSGIIHQVEKQENGQGLVDFNHPFAPSIQLSEREHISQPTLFSQITEETN